MIYSDRDIRAALAAGEIIIEPMADPDLQIQACSVDLRLGSTFRVFRHADKAVIDPLADDASDFTELHEVKPGEPFYLHPGEFALGSTQERVKLPDNVVGRVDGRSSIGRLAILVHATAGFIDAGFEGTITLELSNVGKMPVALHPNMRICQISFEEMKSPAEHPYGSRPGSKYQGQRGPTESRIRDDLVRQP